MAFPEDDILMYAGFDAAIFLRFYAVAFKVRCDRRVLARKEHDTSRSTVWFHGAEGKEGGVTAEVDVSRLEGRGGARGFADFVLCSWVKSGSCVTILPVVRAV